MAVVCAGPKAILDVPATIEYLETRGVPVVVIGTPDVPGFYARSSGVPAPIRWRIVDGRGATSSPPPRRWASDRACSCACPCPRTRRWPRTSRAAAIERAVREADAAGIHGPATTPVAAGPRREITDGASIRANTALIVNNARVAAELAGRLRGGVAACFNAG